MRHFFRRARSRRRRTKQSSPAVPSTAANFELLISSGGETRRENASSCDPDKRMMHRQGKQSSKRDRCSVRCPQRIQGVLYWLSSTEDSGPCSNARMLSHLVATCNEWRPCV